MILDFLDFIRFRISASASLVSVAGYLFFSPMGYELVFVAMAAFFVCAAGYSYNGLKDEKEDAINNRNSGALSGGKLIYAIPISCLLVGMSVSVLLVPASTFFFALFAVMLFIYSFFRVKRYLIIKNVYTAFGLGLVFLAGAIMGASVDSAFIPYLITSFFFLIGSIISDLRDYHGDRSCNIRTIPVVFGREDAKNILYFLLLSFFITVLAFGIHKLFILLPFVAAELYLIRADRPDHAHLFGTLAVLLMPLCMLF